MRVRTLSNKKFLKTLEVCETSKVPSLICFTIDKIWVESNKKESTRTLMFVPVSYLDHKQALLYAIKESIFTSSSRPKFLERTWEESNDVFYVAHNEKVMYLEVKPLATSTPRVVTYALESPFYQSIYLFSEIVDQNFPNSVAKELGVKWFSNSEPNKLWLETLFKGCYE
jgi:hypothetical protein